MALLAALTAEAGKKREAVTRWQQCLHRMLVFLAFARRELLKGRALMDEHADRTEPAPPKLDSMYMPDFSWFSLFGDKAEFVRKFGLGRRRGLLISAARNIGCAEAALRSLHESVGDEPLD